MHQKPKLPLKRINPGPHAMKGKTGEIAHHKPVGGSGSTSKRVMPNTTKALGFAKAKNNPVPAAKTAAYGRKVKIGDLKD